MYSMPKSNHCIYDIDCYAVIEDCVLYLAVFACVEKLY
jgi:hypothetical protein